MYTGSFKTTTASEYVSSQLPSAFPQWPCVPVTISRPEQNFLCSLPNPQMNLFTIAQEIFQKCKSDYARSLPQIIPPTATGFMFLSQPTKPHKIWSVLNPLVPSQSCPVCQLPQLHAAPSDSTCVSGFSSSSLAFLAVG